MYYWHFVGATEYITLFNINWKFALIDGHFVGAVRIFTYIADENMYSTKCKQKLTELSVY
jgi:hypothetical protein